MRDNNKDRTIERNYIQKRRFLVREYELVNIVFPTSRHSRVRNLVGEARQVLKNLERAGELRVLEGKVLPPLNPPPAVWNE